MNYIDDNGTMRLETPEDVAERLVNEQSLPNTEQQTVSEEKLMQRIKEIENALCELSEVVEG